MPSIRRSKTLKTLHPALKFQSQNQLAGHRFEGSFVGSDADTNSTSGSFDYLQWPSAMRYSFRHSLPD